MKGEKKRIYLTLAYSRNGMFELAMQTHNKRRRQQQQQRSMAERKICVRIGGTKWIAPAKRATSDGVNPNDTRNDNSQFSM